MIITTIETIPGMKIKAHCGLVSGSSVRSKDAIQDLGAWLKNLIGGELKSYTKLLTEAREEALARMVEQAKVLKANAIVNVRFETAAIASGAAEVYAYGTAIEVVQMEAKHV